MFIDEQLKMNLNGVPQYVSIRAEKENDPLLIYLHGGPGDAALPLVTKYNKMLSQRFTLIVWEQRGAGKSYYKFDAPITIDVFLNDLHSLVEQLLSRFHQSSLYLTGHSWGSILGLRFVKAYPELVRTYIGCGPFNICGGRSCKQTLKPKHIMALRSSLSRADMTVMCPLLWRRNTLTGLRRKSSFIGLRNPVIFRNGVKARDLIS